MLDGLRVLDLTMWRPGPYATLLLAGMGADVLKVEPPGGEPMRAFAGHFGPLNAGKRGIVLDLKDPEGLARFLELAAEADAVVTGFRPGVAERLGIGSARLRAARPSLVTCALTGYGETGPLAGVPGHDVNYRATAAALPPGGLPPDAVDLPLADMAAATTAAFALTAACLRAAKTSEGAHLDIGLADTLAHWVSTAPPALPGGDGIGPVAGYGVYTCADGLRVALGVVSEDHLWRATCTALGLSALAEEPFGARLSRVRELDDQIRQALKALPRDTALERLTKAGAPASAVLDRARMLGHPHFQARGVIAADATGAPGTGSLVPGTSAGPAGPAPGLDEHAGQGWRPR
ncbi:crotonobetainyl-CoA:carnitine CoA-transferase CaiB-like acyl-CoA transferase [Actinocorallia herbida]|uniref:Crotonobetainyl-CoA:carnitine CoA-transferase CaiB-like acyl-CoA transferase n=1 Tax=Actinocorallia herbida TaxID=58109 RepID=A0A3N1CSX6_9ACTN|nr:CoA transferase [Actinocorallia herbida]ROO84422.1 crotonobetainyl-CoA:carnitine CoA-transferase CaiB-like acyl-CoA transferase [Actinocorallia herbida]